MSKRQRFGLLSCCAVFAVASLVSGPGWATDNGSSTVNSADIYNACLATQTACLSACQAMGGTKFSDEFARQACQTGCEEAARNCVNSAPARANTGRIRKRDRLKVIGQ